MALMIYFYLLSIFYLTLLTINSSHAEPIYQQFLTNDNPYKIVKNKTWQFMSTLIKKTRLER